MHLALLTESAGYCLLGSPEPQIPGTMALAPPTPSSAEGRRPGPCVPRAGRRVSMAVLELDRPSVSEKRRGDVVVPRMPVFLTVFMSHRFLGW
jgi:hypothetical protein